MRVGWLAAASTLFLAGCGSETPPSKADLPVFEMRSVRPETPHSQAASVLTCVAPSAKTSCRFIDSTVAGEPTSTGYLEFEPTGFAYMFLSWDSSHYASVLAALREAYGEPCRIDPAPRTDALNPDFSSDTVVWCFRTGEAKFKQYQFGVQYSTFTYWDDSYKGPDVPAGRTPDKL